MLLKAPFLDSAPVMSKSFLSPLLLLQQLMGHQLSRTINQYSDWSRLSLGTIPEGPSTHDQDQYLLAHLRFPRLDLTLLLPHGQVSIEIQFHSNVR